MTNVTEQFPNCLNTMCFLEASITGIIGRCIECWDLDVPANRTPSHPRKTLAEEAVVFTHLRASSFSFSCPLVFRAGFDREPFLILHAGPRPPSEARVRRKHACQGPTHITFASGSLLRNSDAAGDEECYPEDQLGRK